MSFDELEQETARLTVEYTSLKIEHARLSATPHTAGELAAHILNLRAHIQQLRARIEQMRQRSRFC